MNVNNNVNNMVSGQQRKAANGSRAADEGAANKKKRDVVVLWRELGDGETRTYEFMGAFTGHAGNGNRYAGLVLRDGRLLFSHEPEIIEAVHDAVTKHGAGVKLSGTATYTAKTTASGYKSVSPVGFTLSITLPLSRRLSAAGAVIDETATTTISVRYVPASNTSTPAASMGSTSKAAAKPTPQPTPEQGDDEDGEECCGEEDGEAAEEEEYLYSDPDSTGDGDGDIEDEEAADTDAGSAENDE